MSSIDKENSRKEPGAEFVRLVHELEPALADSSPSDIPDEYMQRLMAIAVKLYAAKAEEADTPVEPFTSREAVSATEVGITAGSMIRAVEIDLFELVAWQALAE